MPFHYLTVSVGQKSGYRVAGFFAQGHRRLRPWWWHFHLELESFLKAHLGCWQKSVPFSCRTEMLIFLLAIGQGPFSTPRGCTWVLATWSPDNIEVCFFEDQWEYLSLLLRAHLNRWSPSLFWITQRQLISDLILLALSPLLCNVT